MTVFVVLTASNQAIAQRSRHALAKWNSAYGPRGDSTVSVEEAVDEPPQPAATNTGTASPTQTSHLTVKDTSTKHRAITAITPPLGGPSLTLAQATNAWSVLLILRSLLFEIELEQIEPRGDRRVSPDAATIEVRRLRGDVGPIHR